jgi:hypothetical protein
MPNAELRIRNQCRLAVTVPDPNTSLYPRPEDCPSAYWIVFVDTPDGGATILPRQNLNQPRVQAFNLVRGETICDDVSSKPLQNYVEQGALVEVCWYNRQWFFSRVAYQDAILVYNGEESGSIPAGRIVELDASPALPSGSFIRARLPRKINAAYPCRLPRYGILRCQLAAGEIGLCYVAGVHSLPIAITVSTPLEVRALGPILDETLQNQGFVGPSPLDMIDIIGPTAHYQINPPEGYSNYIGLLRAMRDVQRFELTGEFDDGQAPALLLKLGGDGEPETCDWLADLAVYDASKTLQGAAGDRGWMKLVEGRWEVLHLGADALRWGKVQANPVNGAGTAVHAFSVKTCRSDGSDETGEAFYVYSPLKPHAYTALLEGDVVGYLPDPAGENFIVTDCWQSGWRCLATLGADITPASTSIPVTFLGLIVGPEPVLQYAENPLHFTAPQGSVVELAYRSTAAEWYISSVADNGEAIDVRVKVTADDAESGFLDDKLVTTDPHIGKSVETDQQTGVQQLRLAHTGPDEIYTAFDPTPPELTLVETTLTQSRPFPQFDAKGHKAGDNSSTAASTVLVKGDGVWINVSNDEGDLLVAHDGPGEPAWATSAFSLSVLNNRLTLNAHVVLIDARGHVAGEDDYSTYIDLPVPIEGEVVIEGHDPWIIVSESEGVITIHHGGPGSATGDPYNGVQSVNVTTDPETGDVYLDVGSHQLTHDVYGHKVAISAEYLVRLPLIKVENVVDIKFNDGYLKFTTEEQWVLKTGTRTDHNLLELYNCPGMS